METDNESAKNQQRWNKPATVHLLSCFKILHFFLFCFILFWWRWTVKWIMNLWKIFGCARKINANVERDKKMEKIPANQIRINRKKWIFVFTMHICVYASVKRNQNKIFEWKKIQHIFANRKTCCCIAQSPHVVCKMNFL